MDVITALGDDNARLTVVCKSLHQALQSLYQGGHVPSELLKQTILALEEAETIEDSDGH